MLVFKKRRDKRHLGFALALLGVSLAIQVAPALWHRWADVREVSGDLWFPVIGAGYLLLLGYALVKGRAALRH